MTESEYIRVVNRVKVTVALQLLRNVIGGDDYGISKDEISEIAGKLYDLEARLFASYETEAE